MLSRPHTREGPTSWVSPATPFFRTDDWLRWLHIGDFARAGRLQHFPVLLHRDAAGDVLLLDHQAGSGKRKHAVDGRRRGLAVVAGSEQLQHGLGLGKIWQGLPVRIAREQSEQ